jgi:hypothetical protein
VRDRIAAVLDSGKYRHPPTRRAALLSLGLATAVLLPACTLHAGGQDVAAPAPQELIRRVRDNYRGLNTFTMRIEHHDDSGLYPGAYTQTLRWRKGSRFELVVISQGDTHVPDFYADGRQVLWIRPGNQWETQELTIRPGISPGWEVSGGLILSWLQDTERDDLFFSPPPGVEIAWSYGPRKQWQGRPVRELVATLKMESERGQRREGKIYLFVDAKDPLLVGYEAPRRPGPDAPMGWAHYVDQKLNVNLPATVGNPPVSPR